MLCTCKMWAFNSEKLNVGIMHKFYLRVLHVLPEYLDGQSQTKPEALSLHTPRRQGGGESLHLITANKEINQPIKSSIFRTHHNCVTIFFKPNKMFSVMKSWLYSATIYLCTTFQNVFDVYR